MNVGKAVGFVFEDEQWISRILLDALIGLIPFFGSTVLTGYGIAVLRNVKRGLPRPLPGWDRIGEYFVDGLLFWVALLVYSIPLVILMCLIVLVWILPAAAASGDDLRWVLAILAGLVSAGVGCLAFLYAIVLWLLYPVLQIRYAESGRLAACLRFGEVFSFLLAHIGQVVIAQFLVWAAGLILTTALGAVIGALGLIPLFGWVISALLGFAFLPVGVWLVLFSSYVYGLIGPSPTAEAALL